MTTTYTHSNTSTFSRTHAKYLASKIAADLLQIQIFYGEPLSDMIDAYIEEATILLLGGYLESVDYGFQRDDKWILVVKFVASFDGALTQDDRSGGVEAGIDIRGARWSSYLRKNSAFYNLPLSDQNEIETSLPINRVTGAESETVKGVWQTNKFYSQNGVGLTRKTFRPF